MITGGGDIFGKILLLFASDIRLDYHYDVIGM
jgi:hypothetical protein